MSIAQTFTVTVQSTDSGNKYIIDGVQQDTIMIGAGLTYKLDQSDSSNSNHPLRFSTTSNGTWAGGSEYTTGVTTNGVPGNAGAYTQIAVEGGAPSTLYYYCTNHSGMGGQANTDGWGRSQWGQSDWGDTNIYTVGWSANTWGFQSWGSFPTVELTGLSATASTSSLTVVTGQGWGSDTWGFENWGESTLDVSPTGLSTTSSIGALSVSLEEIIPLTGLATTSAVGALAPTGSLSLIPTGLSTTPSVGAININSTHLLTGLSTTSAVGALAPQTDISLTLSGQLASTSLNLSLIHI